MTFKRHRRLRVNNNIRDLVRENVLRVEDLIYPLFVVEGEGIKREIPSMPDVFHFSLDMLGEELEELMSLGIRAIILFGVPNEKDDIGKAAESGILQEAITYIKEKFEDMYVIADTCLCQYTSHGHCGMLEEGHILNDPSLDRLVEVAVSQAKAGADMIAPSNMMDGFVYAIRKGLDKAGFSYIPLMSYAVKYSSSFYGPFRDAANSSPMSGDRKSYQMDPSNSSEAMREAMSDIEEGADIIMVKPGLSYMDILSKLKAKFDLPLAIYNVSGEYSMVKAASSKGWIDEDKVVMEILTSFKRSGADLILSYHAKRAAEILKSTH